MSANESKSRESKLSMHEEGFVIHVMRKLNNVSACSRRQKAPGRDAEQIMGLSSSSWHKIGFPSVASSKSWQGIEHIRSTVASVSL